MALSPKVPGAITNGQRKATKPRNDAITIVTRDRIPTRMATAALVTLIKKNFYEGTHCWRMSNAASAEFLQCGATKSDGTGDDGFQFGPLENVPANNTYATGVIAMARATSAYSQATQFFIVYGPTVLDGSTGGYTVVGKVTSGLATMEKNITDKGLTAVSSTTDGSPKVPTTITGATIK